MSQTNGGAFISATNAKAQFDRALAALPGACKVDSDILGDNGDCWNLSAVVTHKCGFLSLARRQTLHTLSGMRYALDDGSIVVMATLDKAMEHSANPESKPKYCSCITNPGKGIFVRSGLDLQKLLEHYRLTK